MNLGRAERMAVGNAVAHEAYPGHHLQRIAASRATGIHPVMRTIGVRAFSEGWGIYAEDLGAEMGLYTTDLDRAGHLVHLLDVAVAYYLDAGTHLRGWTRAMLVDSSRFDLPQFNREVVRDGTITLASLQAKLERWATIQASAKGEDGR